MDIETELKDTKFDTMKEITGLMQLFGFEIKFLELVIIYEIYAPLKGSF